MIKFKLKDLMEKENITINKLSKETGISRPSLTAMVNNESRGVQFDTLEKLMDYFDISITDILVEENNMNILQFISYKSLDEVRLIKAHQDKKISKKQILDTGYDENKFDTYSPDKFWLFLATFILKGEKGPSFTFEIKPVISHNEIIKLDIIINEYQNKTDLETAVTIFNKLTPQKIVEIVQVLIMAWIKYFQVLEENVYFSKLFTVNIFTLNKKIDILFPIRISKETKKNTFTINVDSAIPFIEKKTPSSTRFSDNLLIKDSSV